MEISSIFEEGEALKYKEKLVSLFKNEKYLSN